MVDPAKTENPEIMPQVVHLVDLLRWAREGRLRIPRFQRGFIWQREDILGLFDSIANQYPIGTLFFWEPDEVPESLDHLGPLALPEPRGQTWLVLDGQQRLTALVGVLLAGHEHWGRTVEGDGELDIWKVFFDASEEAAFVYPSGNQEIPSSWFPVTTLLDTMSFFRQVEKIRDSASPDEVGAWVDRAQGVARAIQSYRVPIVLFVTNDPQDATEVFYRLNRITR